ncbi:MAG: hypothetical protein LBR49_03340 [Tannerella sp.]|jgi:hypothetical protein|nr:hypothetical protein [Tannerella sp.]
MKKISLNKKRGFGVKSLFPTMRRGCGIFMLVVTPLFTASGEDRLYQDCYPAPETEYGVTDDPDFPAETMIIIPNGEKPMSQLVVGDEIWTLNTETNRLEKAAVAELVNLHYHKLYVLDFGEIKIKTTEDLPFYSKGKYYSVTENSKHGVTTKALVKGQKIQLLVNGKLQKKKLKEIKPISTCENVVIITKLDKNKLYFVNGAPVLVETVPATDAHN